ncbi:MAG TPA: MoaD/ThiS family protein [Solirubrobacteraceae bacterium]
MSTAPVPRSAPRAHGGHRQSGGAAGAMIVRVRLFAILREHAGIDHIELRLEPRATVADALAALSHMPPIGELLSRIPVHMAVNRDYAAPDTVLSADDELALIPPLSGG